MDHGTQMSGDCTEVSNTPETTELSVVLPVYNEKDNLIQMHAELKRSLDNIGKPYEILFVDDGSDDGSMEILEDISATDCSVRVVQFRRNFGQTAALAAGITGDRTHYAYGAQSHIHISAPTSRYARANAVF